MGKKEIVSRAGGAAIALSTILQGTPARADGNHLGPINPGETKIVGPGTFCAGDVEVTYKGTKIIVPDNNPNTGQLTSFNDTATVFAQWGASCDKNTESRYATAKAGIERTGCINGCPEGVVEKTVGEQSAAGAEKAQAPTAVPYEAPKTSGYDFVGEKPYPTALPRAEALKQSEAAGIDHQAQPGEIVFVMRNSIVQGDVVTVDQNGKIVTNITDTDPDTCDIVIFNKDAKVELPYGGNITYYGNEPNPITLGSGLGRFTLEAIEHGGENNQGCKTVIVKQSP